jgi:hypothetical protein
VSPLDPRCRSADALHPPGPLRLNGLLPVALHGARRSAR